MLDCFLDADCLLEPGITALIFVGLTVLPRLDEAVEALLLVTDERSFAGLTACPQRYIKQGFESDPTQSLPLLLRCYCPFVTAHHPSQRQGRDESNCFPSLDKQL